MYMMSDINDKVVCAKSLLLTLVTNKLNTPVQDYLRFISVCAESGLNAIQLREKNLSFEKALEFGIHLQEILRPLGIPLIVNDNLDLCLKLNAAGLHLGQSDGDVQKARQLLGPNRIIGLSVNTIAQLEKANKLSINYVGIGTIFPTQNKANIQTMWGISGLQKAVKISKYPIIAIGGIDESNAALVMETGVKGIAAIGAFHNSVSPETTIKNLRKITYKETRS